LLKPKQSKDENKTIVTVTLGDIEENVTAQGKLEPKEFVDVGAQVTGQLQKIYVQIGDNVTAGQLLAQIDPGFTRRRCRQMRLILKTCRLSWLGSRRRWYSPSNSTTVIGSF